MTMAAVFLAQATNTPLDLRHQIRLLARRDDLLQRRERCDRRRLRHAGRDVASCARHSDRVLAILVGIDRFMSECRAITNLIGNGVATIVISRWEGEVTPRQLRENMREPEQRYRFGTAAGLTSHRRLRFAGRVDRLGFAENHPDTGENEGAPPTNDRKENFSPPKQPADRDRARRRDERDGLQLINRQARQEPVEQKESQR